MLVIALGKDRPELVADLPAVVALARRTVELDPDYGDGAAHELLITIESLPANMGGSLERAREHFARAVELGGGRRASPYVTFAESVSVATQDREEFETMLAAALAIDPDAHPGVRLENLIAQRRARHLLATVDELFF